MSRGGNEARRSFQQELSMNKQILLAGAIVAALAVPFAANAQSNATSGAVGGAVGGAIVGGPVGAVVGGVGGAIVGGIADDRRAGFNTYVVKEKRTSYKYDHDVVVGAERGCVHDATISAGTKKARRGRRAFPIEAL
jgi:hypothetical protein